MNKEIKQQWIEALRSGRYKQTRGSLKVRNGAMCCLGLLEHKVLGDEYSYDGRDYFNSKGLTVYPSTETESKTNLDANMCFILARLNDDDKYSFEQIADYIEENL